MAPLAMVLADWFTPGNQRPRAMTILVTIIVSFAYSLTLFPIDLRPLPVQNSLPMIFIILTGVTLMSILRGNGPVGEAA
jgi:hypothetical protein